MTYTESEKSLIREMMNSMLESGAEESANVISSTTKPIIGEPKIRKEHIIITIKRETDETGID